MARRQRITDLFFIKRRPRWNVPQEWEMPLTQEELTALIAANDFVVEADIVTFLEQKPQKTAAGAVVTVDSFRTVRDDLAFMHTNDFIGEYFRNAQAAMHFQNLYYRYSWFFGIFAVLTTLATVMTLSASTAPENSAERVAPAIFAAIMGAATTFVSTRMRSIQPQRKWYAARRRTEALRSHYFLFLIHARPYRGTDYQRRFRLYQTAAQVQTIGRTSASSTEEVLAAQGMDDHYSRSEHEDFETAFLKSIYIQRRYDRQIDWYENRVLEFEANSSFTSLVAAILLAVAAIIAAFSPFVNTTWVQILVAVLPTAAATIVSAQQIYGWDRQASLYEETISRLKDLRGKLKLDNPAVDDEREVADAVAACEDVFSAESDQWGQDVLQVSAADRRAALMDQLDDTLDRINLPDDIKSRIRLLAEGSDTQRRPQTTPVNPVEPPIT
jgi:hypothetical protein